MDFAGSTGLRIHMVYRAKYNAYISYCGAGTRSRSTETRSTFSHGKDLVIFEPKILRFLGFRIQDPMVSAVSGGDV